MRSAIGVASAVVFLLALPAAIGSQIVSDGAAEFTIHVAVGVGSALLAFAVFDFGLPRWVTWIGAAAAGAFGSIFLLQAASQVVGNDAFKYLAFDVLGQGVERVLPYLILVWFGALLVWGSHGKSRILGLAVMTIVVCVELASVIGPLVGFNIESQKALFLLPFIWLLAEGAKRRPVSAAGHAPRPPAFADSPTG
jgi:hypothetical protein